MRWCSPGFEDALTQLVSRLRATPWPGPPTGYEALTPARPMRAVLRGTWEGSGEVVPVVVKWSRAIAAADHVSRRLRGGKGSREGRALRALLEQGVPAPVPLAWTDEAVDVLVTRAVDDLQPLPRAAEASSDLVHAIASLLARAHAVGLRHRDLHAANLAVCGKGPTFVDLGGARVAGPLDERARIHALARARNGLLGRARRSLCLRALRAYLTACGHADPAGIARAWTAPIEREARRLARRFLRGRDRRATRSGKHFDAFLREPDVRGIRWRDATTPDWRDRAGAWLTAGIQGEEALKPGARVVRVPAPGDAGAVVVKRFGPLARGRLPRPLRAFRLGFALLNRHLPVPQPLLAAATADGAGICVTAWVDAPDLHAYCGGGRAGAFAALEPTQRLDLLGRLGRTLRALHDAEVTHRDLKAPNLLVGRDGPAPCILITDLEGVRLRRHPVGWARRARDLARLDASLDARTTDRLRVLRAYWRVLPRPPTRRRAFVRRIAAHVRRKRGPEGDPR